MKIRTVFVALLFIAALSLVLGCSHSTPSYYQPPPKSTPTPTPVWITQSSNLVNAAITVSAGGYYDQPFQVVSSMRNARVTGSFRASGGSGNDIVTLIMGDMDFTNWANGHQAKAYYQSGKVTVADIDATITTPGRYHLVFSNTFSTLSSKKVSTTVSLSWSELRYQ